MGFRDDTQALRTKVQGLREELDALEGQKRAIEAERSELGGDVEERARILAGSGHKVFVFLGVFLVPILVAVVFLAGGGGSGAETMYGRVSGGSGAMPVATGTRCAVFLHPVNDDDSDWDGRVGVICGDRVVYGGGSSGYLTCDWRDDRAWRCGDPDYTANGGDPRLELLRRERRVHLEDRRPDWSLDIELTTPPLGVGGER
ncbi:MAG TPA: hypothetical protein RMH99_03555 [Sandaracinaceae bacterium LLY-WYZ-13_1]|nr:hypothetical protein [Sandaracinaceae bacterium LLY-WYZ-13_1]